MSIELWNTSFLDSKRQIQDPLADAVIDQLVFTEGEDAARKLFETLIRNVEIPVEKLPSAAKEYLQITSRLPEWTNLQQVNKAHQFFVDHGPKMMLILYFKSLPILYACKNGAQVLFRTGRLVHDPQKLTAFTRRIAETAQFLIDVLTPEALLPAAKGIRMIQKIRLIHASIRRFMNKTGWSDDVLGKPINQEDMAITLMTFSIAIMDGLHQLGIHESADKEAAYFHTWMAIGSLLGIDQDLLPENPEQGRILQLKILERQAASSAEGKKLAEALVHFSEISIPGKVLDDSPELFIRYLAGQDIGDMLGIKMKLGCLSFLVPAGLTFIFRKAERLEEKSKKWKQRIDFLSVEITKAMLNYFDKYKESNFRIPENMQKHWLPNQS